MSSKLRIHRMRHGRVGVRGPCGRCKLGGNISPLKYLSRLARAGLVALIIVSEFAHDARFITPVTLPFRARLRPSTLRLTRQ